MLAHHAINGCNLAQKYGGLVGIVRDAVPAKKAESIEDRRYPFLPVLVPAVWRPDASADTLLRTGMRHDLVCTIAAVLAALCLSGPVVA
jgi:signal transduction histidine kinase